MIDYGGSGSGTVLETRNKVKAENGILPLADDTFKVVILRPPMIYGKGSKGNYPTLVKFAKKMLLFPYVKNQRSMLYIENLMEFIRLMIVNEENGIFFPQNKEYSNTSEMVKMIGAVHGKKVRLVKGFTWVLKILSLFTGLVNKAFGNLCYDLSISEYKKNYRIKTLEESIKEYDAFVAVTNNSETNILACVAAKSLGVARVIAEVENIEYIKLAESMGVDAVINKKLITASRIFKFTLSNKVRFIKYMSGTNAEVLEYIVAPDTKITKTTLKEMNFPRNAIIGGIIRGNESFIAVGDTKIEAYDRVAVFALPDAVKEVDKFFK